MSENFSGITPVDWAGIVAEAIRRRKAEKLTQREHAALASVSIPTIVAFDRGEKTLSLSKAFDILRVVGLVSERREGSPQESFVQQAFKRWLELTGTLPADSPARFQNGWYRFDYALEGELKHIDLHRLPDILRKSVQRYTGWPLFLLVDRKEIEPREVDGVIECWLKPSAAGLDRPLTDAAHCDFWRVAPTGRALLLRGYQEDSQETFEPRKIFDTTLPVWRIGECILHAQTLAMMLAADPAETKIRFRAFYTGLSGRLLRSWATPLSDLVFGGGGARSDEAVLEAVIPVDKAASDLADYVLPLVSSLFERFGVTGLAHDRVDAELGRLREGRFGSIRS